MSIEEGMTAPAKILTIGHSNHSLEDFMQLLAMHDIEVLVDVRTSPFSKYSPHFNKDNLKTAVQNAGRKYLFLGRELGGMPRDQEFYDEEGYVLYWKIAETPLFQQGIERIRNGIASYTVALLCGEENPSHCHRRQLIGRALMNSGVEVCHIRGQGLIQSESDLDLATSTNTKQLTIFTGMSDDKPWRSTQPVLQRE